MGASTRSYPPSPLPSSPHTYIHTTNQTYPTPQLTNNSTPLSTTPQPYPAQLTPTHHPPTLSASLISTHHPSTLSLGSLGRESSIVINNPPHPTNIYPTNIYPTNIYPTNIYPTNIYPTNISTLHLFNPLCPTNIYPTTLSLGSLGRESSIVINNLRPRIVDVTGNSLTHPPYPPPTILTNPTTQLNARVSLTLTVT